MEKYKIIEYQDTFREGLHAYLERVFPYYSNEYIEYLLNRASDRVPAKIVIDIRGKIVGCHLYSCSRAMINRRVCDIQWGHDTFLDEDCRREIGLDFILSIQSTKSFGLGLTKIAEDIQRKFNNVFFEGVFNYYTCNRKILLAPFQKLFSFHPTIKCAEELRVGMYSFKRVKDANEIRIPNNGFWFKDYRDIDFVRDAEFINNRFVNCKVYDYIVYSLESDDGSCYLVARITSYRGMPVLMLSDYRYSNDDERLLSLIIKAARKLAIKSNVGLILIVSGDTNMTKVFSGKICYKTPYLFMTSRKERSDMSFIITGGDSDADFLK